MARIVLPRRVMAVRRADALSQSPQRLIPEKGDTGRHLLPPQRRSATDSLTGGAHRAGARPLGTAEYRRLASRRRDGERSGVSATQRPTRASGSDELNAPGRSDSRQTTR